MQPSASAIPPNTQNWPPGNVADECLQNNLKTTVQRGLGSRGGIFRYNKRPEVAATDITTKQRFNYRRL